MTSRVEVVQASKLLHNANAAVYICDEGDVLVEKHAAFFK